MGYLNEKKRVRHPQKPAIQERALAQLSIFKSSPSPSAFEKSRNSSWSPPTQIASATDSRKAVRGASKKVMLRPQRKAIFGHRVQTCTMSN